MTNEDLEAEALALIRASDEINHPMIPRAVKATVQKAARVVGELTRRELKRCQQQKTTGNQ